MRPNLFDHLRYEPGGDARLWAKEQFSQEFAHARTDPTIQRKPESLFLFGGDVRRKQLPYERRESILVSPWAATLK